MTAMERGASETGAPPRPRRRANSARSEMVQVYKILTEATEPLEIPQIAERMPRTGYLSAAMQAYRELKEETDPTWLDGKGDVWGDAAQSEAMEWWVRRIVKQGVGPKFFRNISSNPKNGRVEGIYTPGRPPTVRRKVWVEKTELVPWAPEHDAALTRGHAAGMEFLIGLDDWRRKPKPRAAETRELLDLAERAIRANYGAT